MRKLTVIFLVLAAFDWSAASYGASPTRVLVYKGKLKASHSIFDVNDTNDLFSRTIEAYWAVQVSTDDLDKGSVLDSSAVLYDTRMKYYRVVLDCISIDPCDPCGVVMFRFNAVDDNNGLMSFYAVGEGRMLKYSSDDAVAPDYTAKTLKGTGALLGFAVFDPAETVSGPITVKMTLDAALTKAANPDLYYPDDIINNIVTQWTGSGGWREWPDVNYSYSWTADERCFLDGPPDEFDDISVKDPSIVYSGGQWHLFYTGRDSNSWRMGYVSANSVSDLNSTTRNYMSALNAGSYFCAPQVFWFESKNKWYLIFQSGLGASYSTNTDIGDPNGWTSVQSMGFSDGIDFWCISNGANVYCFYSAQDGTYIIKRRSTSVANFPAGWSPASVAARNTFEAPCVYKNKADGKYYMLAEDISRHYELWSTRILGGTWTKVLEKWASKDNLIDGADHWTDQVSHGEILRSGTNERMEIDNINRCQFLIQGVVDGSYGGYADIPYDLGLIRNY